MQNSGVRRKGSTFELASPSFIYCIDISSGLRAESWTNLLTGRKVALGGKPELELDLDAAEQRIWITGWRVRCSHEQRCDPGAELERSRAFAAPEFDDGDWKGAMTVALEGAHTDPRVEDKFYWARTHVFLPASAEDKPLGLHLGGVGLFDFSYMRVFINGFEVGERHASDRWNEPAVFNIGPESDARPHLRFGQDNVIAVQATGYRARTKRMDELDPARVRHLPMKCQWPGQFEQYLAVGQPLTTPELKVVGMREAGDDAERQVVFDLSSPDSGMAASVTYQWNSTDPVLRRFASIRNEGKRGRTVLNVRLGTYVTDAPVSEGEQGFPVYIGEEFYLSLAHPSGWATGQDGQVSLRQYPGRNLAPGDNFECMEAVLGVALAGRARESFLAHVLSRCRRVVRGHDVAYAIFEPFGARPGQIFDETEEFVLDNLAKVAQGQRESGCHFDLYSVDFWVDYHGDLQRFDPVRFPHGLDPIRQRLDELGTSPGLWIDSSMESWTIGGNPVVRPTWTHDPAYGPDRVTLCRATDPVKTMYSTAFRHHIRRNRVRLCKFDNLQAICYNPAHDHLPGIYSTEAIQSAVLGTLKDLDSESRDVFLMLYWGHRSPWWLLHADTLFEPGLGIEASSPSSSPTLYIRDSVTVGLDQAQWWCEDIPAIGKDSLGIWLSDWKWNSSVGKERWQEGFVMDICRGSLLAQPWSDEGWLAPDERRQMAQFIDLLKANARCFANPRFVIGNPWKVEPYGYCCTDGERAFVSLNNATWHDAKLTLELNSAWGMKESGAWDIYRLYPEPARLKSPAGAFRGKAVMSLRPFEVVLLEIVPSGRQPSLNAGFPVQPIPESFAEPSRKIELDSPSTESAGDLPAPKQMEDPAKRITRKVIGLRCEVPTCRKGGLLAISAQVKKNRVSVMIGDLGKHFAARASVDGKDSACWPVVREESYPACWQAWRIAVEPSRVRRTVEMLVVVMMPQGVEMVWEGHFIPR